MTWDDKNNKAQCTKTVVTVSNWHFNRNTLKNEKAPTCKLEDIMVTLKLSSTVFFESEGGTPVVAAANADEQPDSTLPTSPGAAVAAHSDGGSVQHTNGESYFFDRNGAIIPYSAFIALLDSDTFEQYLKTIYRLREGKPYCPPVTVADDSNDGNDSDVVVDEDDEEEFETAAKRRKRSDFVKNLRKSKKAINFVDDEDEDDLPELGVTPIPSEHDEEDEEEIFTQQTQATKIAEGKKEEEDAGDKSSEKKEGRKTRKK
jgi:hypothetical protein